MRAVEFARNLWTPEKLGAPLLNPVAPSEAFKIDPKHLYAPAVHKTMDLSRVFRIPSDLYVHSRDREHLLSPGRTKASGAHRSSLANFSIYTLPGWGSFTFGAEALNYAHDAAGHGLTHISVAHDGTVMDRSDFTIIGSPRMALAPEWITEFRTVVSRTWFALQLKKQKNGSLPERELFLGHSKGGCLTYLLACLVKSHKENRLDEFLMNLTDNSGQPVLADFPRERIVEVAEALSDAVFGAIGSPLYGIGDDFAKFADKQILPGVSFNSLTGNSARYFGAGYMIGLHNKIGLHNMIGYKPNEVLDFVVTSQLKPAPLSDPETYVRGARMLSRFSEAPILALAEFGFKGLSRVISPGLNHDGVALTDYPVKFKHHLRIPGATHLDQVQEAWVMQRIFDFLETEGIV